MSRTDAGEPRVGADPVNPGIPPASISLMLRWWNWLWGTDAPAPPAPPPPPPQPEVSVTLRADTSADDLPAVPSDEAVFVGFTNRLQIEGPARDC